MIYFYGGAFDPITLAHEEIIKKLIKLCKKDDKVVVAITNTDEKNYIESFEHRFDNVKNCLKKKCWTRFENIELVEQKNRTYNFLFENYKNEDVTIVLGEDEKATLLEGKWVNSSKIIAKYKILTFTRFSHDPNMIDLSKFSGVSSSVIRDILLRNPFCTHKDVKDYISHPVYEFIKNNKMYKQNSFEYEKEQEEFIKKYQIDKEKFGWAEPSVTADILAYNGDKILLIRRDNFPYKNCWCLCGGFMEKTDEDLRYTASRELHEETNLEINPEKFKQIKTYSHNFDPRMKIVDVAMSIRINAKDMKKAVGSDDAAEAQWFDINDLPYMGFHHRQIVEDWMKQNILLNKYLE